MSWRTGTRRPILFISVVMGNTSPTTVEDQEFAMLALHLVQISLTFIQTLMIQAGCQAKGAGTDLE